MFEMSLGARGANYSPERAEELFEQHRQEIARNTDRLFARLMFFQWLAGIGTAIFVAPLSWAGQSSQVHMHVWAAIFLGGAISLFPIWMTHAWPGATVNRYVIAVAQMLMSALLISLTGGRIETHFHVFGSLVILAFYRDWRVLVPATIVVGLDHFLRGIYWPYSVYGVLTASPLRSLEHAGWVIFEDMFLVISCLRGVSEMRAIASRTAALEASEHSFRVAHHSNQLIMDKTQDVICTADERGRFVSVSAACEQLWGYTPAELIGRPYLDFVCPEDRAMTAEVAKVLRVDGKVTDFVNRCTRKDGTLRDVLWSASWSESDRITFAVAHDVTDRARIEKELREAKQEADRANHEKSDFLSRMSHELRTPLNAILGFGQLLARQNPTESQRPRINHIISAGRHLLNLINEVLDISRVETGNLQLSLEPVCVAGAVEEALSLMRPLAAERSIQLLTTAPLEEGYYVMGDRQRFKQVLLNLLTNGVKYTPVEGKVTISVTATGASRIRIEVSDTGPGISAEKQERLFTPFDRLGAEQTAVEGTGLGLALSQRLTQAMNGSLGVNSIVGQGSTFWVELARAESPFEKVASTKRNGAQLLNGSEPSTRTILYVEDNLSNLTVIEQMLAEEPHIKLITAMQGQLGIELARQHSPDLILLDLHLPDLPGWEVLSRLRADDATREIPVVIISADATSHQIKRLRDAGAQSYLTKPLDMEEFLRVINETSAPLMSSSAAA